MEQTSTSKWHAWDQWNWIWHILTYSLLIFHAFIARTNELRNGPLSIILLLTASLGLWYVPFIIGKRETWLSQPFQASIYFMAGCALWAVLIYMHSAALMLAGMFYPTLFSRLPIRWSVACASLLTTGLFLLTVTWLYPDHSYLPTLAITAGFMLLSAILIGLFINALITQSHERQHLVDELMLARVSLLKVERETATLAERERMAREIHDTLAQDFTSIIMHLSAAQLNTPADSQTHIKQAEQTARQGLNEARRIVQAMRPQQLENASLAEGIEQLALRFSAENSVHVEVVVTGTPERIQVEKETAFLRIVQEALHNIRKHAKAGQVNVTLSYMPDLVALDIVDNGIGFDPADSHGFGMRSMRERVGEYNGTFIVESEPGRGTALGISIPLEKA